MTLTCPLKLDDNGTKPVWKFNDLTVFAEGYIVPCEENFCNVRGENTVGTSYLHIERFSLTNVGNYTCSINTLRRQYNLDIFGEHFAINKISVYKSGNIMLLMIVTYHMQK